MRKNITHQVYDPMRVEHFEPRHFADGRICVLRHSTDDFTHGELHIDNRVAIQVTYTDFDVLWALANHVDVPLSEPLSRASLIRAAAQGRPYIRPYRTKTAQNAIKDIRQDIRNVDDILGNATYGAIRHTKQLGYYATSSLEAERPTTVLVTELPKMW